MKNSNEEANSFHQAFRLLQQVRHWLQDEEYRLQGGTINYAIDTNVLMFYMEPFSRLNYADAFFSEEIGEKNDDLEILASLLASFIFDFSLNGIPSDYFVLPGHGTEFSSLVLNLASKQTEKLSSISDLLTKIDNVNDVANSLDRHARMLLKEACTLNKSIDRIDNLIATKKIKFSLSDLLSSHISDVTEDKINASYLENESIHAEELYTVRSKWFTLISEHAKSSKSTYAIANDARAISYIVLINKLNKDKNKKIVLVTGSEDIHKAAASVDFNYIRHPKYFLASRNMFLISDGRLEHKTDEQKNHNDYVSADFMLIDWINLLFPKAIIRSIDENGASTRVSDCFVREFVHEEQLLENYKQSISLSKNLVLDHKKRCKEHFRGVAIVRKVLSSDVFRDALNSHRSNIRLEEIYDLLYKNSIKTLDQLYATPAWISLWEKKEADSSNIKGIPALRFDKNSLAQNYANILLDRSANKKYSLTDVREIYNKLTHFDNGSNYAAHIIHGLAFAGKGHWHATAALCRVATALSDILPVELKTKSEHLGRESSYLAAIAARRLADCKEKLEKAYIWLQQAQYRDHKKNAEEIDLRFLSEELAIDTARASFDVYISSASIGCYKGLEPRTNKKNLYCQLIVRSSREEKNSQVRKWILRQLLVNLVMEVFMHGYVVKFSEGDMETGVSKAVTEMQNMAKLIIAFFNSERVPFFDTFLEVTRDRPKDGSSLSLFSFYHFSVLMGDFTYKNHDKNSSPSFAVGSQPGKQMPYDEKRFNWMQEVVAYIEDTNAPIFFS